MRVRLGLIHGAGGPARGSRHPEVCNVLRRGYLSLTVAVLMTIPAWPQQKPKDLSDKSLEDLMNIEVTSVSKKEQKMSRTASAIFVITAEDVRRSGARNIPDVLRMVPGLDVAHIDSNKWAISSRGFNEQFADKMLVLIDGRTVFNPLFSGVYWDVQDILLEDIGRIEVIRGPGATVWGANAVNGVINVITKPAKDTQGALLTASAGNQERGSSAVRYGGKLGGQGHYRFFAKYLNRAPFADSSGKDAADDWHVQRGGFRTDWDLTKRDSLTVQGDYYNGVAGVTVPGVISLSPPMLRSLDDRTHVAGGNVLGRWNHRFSDRSETTLQLYYDRADRGDLLLGEVRHTVDLDFDHHVALGTRHEILWGLEQRFTTDRTAGSLTFSFDPSRRGNNLASGFFQDEIMLLPERLWVTLGTKLEHNDFSGLEVQPNIRFLWAPHESHAIWAAVSRATETPSRLEANGRINKDVFPGAGGTPTLLSEFGNPRLHAESVLSSELGYRAQVNKRLSLDVATFYNLYHQLDSAEPGAPFLEVSPPPPHLVLPLVFENKVHGVTHGIELATNWSVTDRWTLHSGYTLLQMHLHVDPSSGDASVGKEIEGESPKQQFQLRSQLNLPHGLEFDTSLQYISRLLTFGVPSYTRLDTRLAWQPKESLEISIVGQDLLRPRHFEFGSADQLASATQVKRSVYGKVTWRF